MQLGVLVGAALRVLRGMRFGVLVGAALRALDGRALGVWGAGGCCFASLTAGC